MPLNPSSAQTPSVQTGTPRKVQHITAFRKSVTRARGEFSTGFHHAHGLRFHFK